MALVSLIVIAGATRPGFLDIGLHRHRRRTRSGWTGSRPTRTPSSRSRLLTYAAASLVTTFGLVRRYRAGGPVVRAQIRWFAGSIAVSLCLLVLMIASSGNEGLNGIAWALWIASLLLPPIAIAVAILRYRLYDIDRIVSNAIGYGVVTVVLFTIFAGVNVVLVSQVSPLVNNEGIAVAASTLLVAALFNPLRTRVQRAVDRRFHRARYDADEMVQEFATRLRDELDLANLVDDLATITTRAVEPTAAALWLRAHEHASVR